MDEKNRDGLAALGNLDCWICVFICPSKLSSYTTPCNICEPISLLPKCKGVSISAGLYTPEFIAAFIYSAPILPTSLLTFIVSTLFNDMSLVDFSKSPANYWNTYANFGAIPETVLFIISWNIFLWSSGISLSICSASSVLRKSV